jgi:hypothetical protein
VILLVLYAAIVWILAYICRRRVAGVLVVIASTLPLIGVGLMVESISAKANAGRSGSWLVQSFAGYGSVLHFVTVVYGLLVTGVAAVVAFAPRRNDHPRLVCHHCGYDLHGNITGQCPECGAMATTDVQRSLDNEPIVIADTELPDFASDDDAAAAEHAGRRPIKLPAHLLPKHHLRDQATAGRDDASSAASNKPAPRRGPQNIVRSADR